MKPHTIAKILILLAAIDMVKTMCGEAEACELTSIPLSYNTVKNVINAIVSNQEETD
jgi:hypothetical protein